MKTHAGTWLALAAALLFLVNAKAAEMSKANVVMDYTDVVMPAQQKSYEAGIKSYIQCLEKNNFKYQWSAWVHVTGKTYVYSYVSDPVEWSDFDSMHASSMACDSVWQSDVNPYLKSQTSAFMIGHEKLGHMPKGMSLGTGLINVTYFKIKNGHKSNEAFKNAMKMIAEAAEKSNWPGYYQVASLSEAGPHSPDYILVWGAKNWADYGKDIEPPLWKMVENVYGKKKADELRETLSEVIVDSSSHVDRYSEEMSYIPSGN